MLEMDDGKRHIFFMKGNKYDLDVYRVRPGAIKDIAVDFLYTVPRPAYKNTKVTIEGIMKIQTPKATNKVIV